MALYADTKQRLQQNMLAQNPLFDLSPDTELDKIVSAVSASVNDVATYIEQTAPQFFLSTARGAALVAKAVDYGVYQEPSEPSVAEVVFSRSIADPSNDTIIPAGTIVSTQQGPGQVAIGFFTTAQGTITATQTSSAPVPVQAQIPGSSGDVQAGTIVVIPLSINGAAAVTMVTNGSPATGGIDVESDSSLLLRTLGNISPSNTPYVIEAAAKGVPGILNASVYDWRDGNGNYTVYAADPAGNLSTDLQNAVLDAVALVDGIGLTRHVSAFGTIPLTITANVAISPQYTQSAVLASVQASIAAWMSQLRNGDTWLPFNVYQAVAGAVDGINGAPGVVDFVITSPSSYVTSTQFQLITYPTPATLTVVSL